MNKIVCIDMDNVTADFENSEVFDKTKPIKSQIHKMYEPEFFYNLNPVPGALSSVRRIMRMGYDVHILSRPVAESAHSYSEKARWIFRWFPELINNLHLTQNKELFRMHYLIDDDARKWKEKVELTGCRFIHFDLDKGKKEMWHEICEFLQKELKNDQNS